MILLPELSFKERVKIVTGVFDRAFFPDRGDEKKRKKIFRFMLAGMIKTVYLSTDNFFN